MIELSTSQRALLAAKQTTKTDMTISVACHEYTVSSALVKQARRLLSCGKPAIVDDVIYGRLTVYSALKQLEGIMENTKPVYTEPQDIDPPRYEEVELSNPEQVSSAWKAIKDFSDSLTAEAVASVYRYISPIIINLIYPGHSTRKWRGQHMRKTGPKKYKPVTEFAKPLSDEDKSNGNKVMDLLIDVSIEDIEYIEQRYEAYALSRLLNESTSSWKEPAPKRWRANPFAMKRVAGDEKVYFAKVYGESVE